MRRLIYSCGERPVKQFVVHKIYQGWITHKARIIILILNKIVLNYTHLIRLRDYGQETIFVKGMLHKPRNHELSILITAHCFDKIGIFVEFGHHIP